MARRGRRSAFGNANDRLRMSVGFGFENQLREGNEYWRGKVIGVADKTDLIDFIKEVNRRECGFGVFS